MAVAWRDLAGEGELVAANIEEVGTGGDCTGGGLHTERCTGGECTGGGMPASFCC